MYFVQKPGTIPEDVTANASTATAPLVFAPSVRNGLSRVVKLELTTGGFIKYFASVPFSALSLIRSAASKS